MFRSKSGSGRVVPQDTPSKPPQGKSYFSKWMRATKKIGPSPQISTRPQQSSARTQERKQTTPLIITIPDARNQTTPRRTQSNITKSLQTPLHIVHHYESPSRVLQEPMIDHKMVQKATTVLHGVRYAYEDMITQIIQRLVAIAHLPIFLQPSLARNKKIRNLVSTYLKEILCGDNIPSSSLTIRTILAAIQNAPLTDSMDSSSDSDPPATTTPRQSRRKPYVTASKLSNQTAQCATASHG